MGLVQNLKKTFSNLVNQILVVLLSHYIKQRAKQTLKKPDNSLSTMSSQNLLTTENQHTTIATSSADTSEKTTMENKTKDGDLIVDIVNWSIDRVHQLAEGDIQSQFDAVAISEEFFEWIEPLTNDSEETNFKLEYLAIEDYSWTEDQEIDTI